MENINSSHLEKLEWLDTKLDDLVSSRRVLERYNFWWKDFTTFTEKREVESWRNISNSEFQMLLSDFLFSNTGSKYQKNFHFETELECGSQAPDILVTNLEIEYFAFDGPREHVPGKTELDSILLDSQLPGAFSFNKIYLAWETDTIIGFELWRNIGLGLACIFMITFILLANIQLSFMVMMMVCVTLVDIVGFLYLWNVHIDIVSCINIVISVGLCVDYSVHIGHAYIVASGSRKEKTIKSLETIGLAVFNGGVTTFLALTMCAGSTSHTFVTFFKVFLLTVLFGLYHGLILLPVLLSLCGPLNNISEVVPVESEEKESKSEILSNVKWIDKV